MGTTQGRLGRGVIGVVVGLSATLAGCGGKSASCGTIGSVSVAIVGGEKIFEGAGYCAMDPGESTSMTFVLRESDQLTLSLNGHVQPGIETCGDYITAQLDGLADAASFFEVPMAGVNSTPKASCTFTRDGRNGTFKGVLQRVKRGDYSDQLIDVSFGFSLPPL